MAMELHVFSNRWLTSVADWQRAIDAEGFPLRLEMEAQLSGMNGLVPATLGERKTGFECFHDNAKETIAFLDSGHLDLSWSQALGFRWRGDFSELQAAWMAATAYAVATDGLVFDHEEAKAMTPQQAREMVAQIVRDVPRAAELLAEAIKKLSTKP